MQAELRNLRPSNPRLSPSSVASDDRETDRQQLIVRESTARAISFPTHGSVREGDSLFILAVRAANVGLPLEILSGPARLSFQSSEAD